jgi:hypothetical protein
MKTQAIAIDLDLGIIRETHKCENPEKRVLRVFVFIIKMF